MIFVSQRANRDPEPYTDGRGNRSATKPNRMGTVWHWAPRHEYTQTRDPEPWACQALHDKGSCPQRGAQPYHLDRAGRAWAPRHDEYDPPVNRILEAVRSEESPWFYFWLTATPAEIEHARKVLTKLAALEEQ